MTRTSRWAAGISSALLLAVAPAVQAQTAIRVPLDQPTIQAAIDAAANGDTVLVSPGTYLENINFSGKAITVTSESGPEVTLIDGNHVDAVVKFISGEGRSSVLSGFTVLNGGSPGGLEGGGIRIENSSPTITGNIIARTRVCTGIIALSSAPLVQKNTIINNTDTGCFGDGGGMSVYFTPSAGNLSAEIVENVIAGNASIVGGGISLWSAGPIIRGNLIEGNTASGLSPCSPGGGIAIRALSDPLIAQNVIVGNSAGCGGGIYWGSTGLRLVNNTIADNDGAKGSGIHAEGTAGQLSNSIIVGRDGQNAVYCEAWSALAFRFNNVLTTAAAPYGESCIDPTGTNGNISSDPLFVNRPKGDYRLQLASPSIDAGDGAAAEVPNRDADGNARILDGNGDGAGIVDMGAHERAPLLTPNSHDFGSLDLGSASVSQTFSLANPGASVLNITSISVGHRLVGAGGPAGFAVAAGGADPCPSLAPTLAPGQACTVVVTFTTPPTLGRKGATLRVVSDISGSPTVAALSAEVAVDTSIVSAPPERTVSGAFAFTFASGADATGFECKLDNQPKFTPCTSPMQFNLPPGPHRFQVRAISLLGDPDPTPATYLWSVVPRARRADFDGDGNADILWRNTSTGENYLYPMEGTTILEGEGYLRAVADLNWKIVGTGDFDGDGRADILWRNSSSGENYVYLMAGSAIKPTEGYVRTVADQSWQVAGIGDFDGDRKDDVLWRNSSTGENYIYFMNGLSIVNEGYLRTLADLNWQLAGLGDFDGDGKDDILWRNSSNGQNYLYFMNGTAIKATEGFITTVPSTVWQVKGVGDFDGDGKADIVWRNGSSGDNYLFPMDGRTVKPGEGFLRTVSDLAWEIVAVRDYDGDGRSDLLWRHSSTGENYLYPMNGRAIKPTEGFIRTVPPGSWIVVAQ